MKQLNWYQIFGQTHTIPDGRTVTPTDDIQIWLNCADIWDKAYTTLAEVLADTDTLSALIASSNAVDYMVRSTTWAVSVSVPVMTSNTTPSGEVIYDGTLYYSNYAWYAFDGNGTTGYGSTTKSNTYIGYHFTQPVCVTRVLLGKPSNSADRAVKNYKIQASNDGVTWVDAYTGVREQSLNDIEITIPAIGKYEYWRVYAIDMWGGDFLSYTTIQFYSASVCENATAMTDIGGNNYASNTLLGDSTWCEAIINSEYFKSVLNAEVPLMTSNTEPEGICSCSRNAASYQPYRAFNITHSYGWMPDAYSLSNDWIQYEFTTSVRVYKFSLKGGAGGGTQTYKLQSSVDGITFVDRSNSVSIATSVSPPSWTDFVSTSSDNAKYWRIAYTARQSSYNGWLQIQYFGRKDV